MPALKILKYVKTTGGALGLGDGAFGWAFVEPPQAESPLMRITTRRLRRVSSFALRVRVFI